MKKTAEISVVLVLLFVMLRVAHPAVDTAPPRVISPASSAAAISLPVLDRDGTSATPEFFLVSKVVDGDTLVINVGGKNETVRLIGVNTPETVDPRKNVECFGKEASSAAKNLLLGKSVRFETDPSQGERDKYGRLLAYIYLEDGTFLNDFLIRNGYGYEYTYKTPYLFGEQFKAAEREARIEKRGLWAEGVCVPAHEISQTVSTSTPVEGYSCGANLYNCSDFKTQSEAQSVFLGCGGPEKDIHKLDVDKDGVVCESLVK